MKTRQRILWGVCAGLLVGAAALTTASALSPDAPHSDLLLANAEALSKDESGGKPCKETMGYDCNGRGSLGVKCANLDSAGDGCRGRGYQCCK